MILTDHKKNMCHKKERKEGKREHRPRRHKSERTHRTHRHREERIPASYVEYDMPVSEAGRIERLKHQVTRHVKQSHRLQHVAGVLGGRVRRHHHAVMGGGVHHPSHAHRVHPHSHVWANSGAFPNVGNVTTVVGSRFAVQ